MVERHNCIACRLQYVAREKNHWGFYTLKANVTPLINVKREV
jgi:hypothetical protein